jgi:hypothetical protein
MVATGKWWIFLQDSSGEYFRIDIPFKRYDLDIDFHYSDLVRERARQNSKYKVGGKRGEVLYYDLVFEGNVIVFIFRIGKAGISIAPELVSPDASGMRHYRNGEPLETIPVSEMVLKHEIFEFEKWK